MNKLSTSIFDKIGYYINEYYKIRFNEISLNYESKSIESKEWQELNLEKLYVEMEMENLKFSFDKLIIYLKAIVEYFNPIIQYFRDLPSCDGNDYISELSKKIHLNSDQEFF